MKVVRLAFALVVVGSAASSCGGRSPFKDMAEAGTDGSSSNDEAGAGGGTGGVAAGGKGGATGGTAAGGKGGATGGKRGGTGGTAVADSGNADSGDADSGLDGGSAVPDRCPVARFCDTFESYATGGPPGGDWQLQTNLGAISVVGEQKVSGTRSVKLTTERNADFKAALIRLSSAAVFPVPNNDYFGRMMFRLESAPEASAHWTFIQSNGLVPGQSYHAVYRYGGQLPITSGTSFVGSQLMANYETPDFYAGSGPGSDCWLHSDKKVVPVGRWACAEWQFEGSTNTMRFWLDGASIDSLTMSGLGKGCVHQAATYPWTAPTFADVALGWESYMNDEARTMYVDDVVIDTVKVGCPHVP
jgi:hypothetical protein